VATYEDFDRYMRENEIPEEELPAALARWLGQQLEASPGRFGRSRPVKRRSFQILSNAS
jgi:hypothetical protein